MSELVEDGDEVVAIRVIELDEGGEWASSISIIALRRHHNSSLFIRAQKYLSPVSVSDVFLERHNPKQQEEFREEAHRLLQDILDKNNEAENRHVSEVDHHYLLPISLHHYLTSPLVFSERHDAELTARSPSWSSS